MEKRAAVTTIMKPNTRTEEADLDVSSTARSLSVLSPSWSGAAKLQQTAQQVSRRTVRITQWETATEDFSCTLYRTFIYHLFYLLFQGRLLLILEKKIIAYARKLSRVNIFSSLHSPTYIENTKYIKNENGAVSRSNPIGDLEIEFYFYPLHLIH